MKTYILALALVLTSSCSWLKSDGKPTAKAALNCLEDSLAAKSRELVPTFVGILAGDTQTWKEQAKTLGKQFGFDAATCAARVAVQKITEPVQSSPEEDPELIKRNAVARLRAFEIEAGYSQ